MKKLHFDLSCDRLDYLIRNAIAHFKLYNLKHYVTPHEHVLVYIAWGLNAKFSDYII